MRFKKKPVEIEAFQLGVDNAPDWFMDWVSANKVILSSVNGRTEADIPTLEGVMHASWGDFVIKGLHGELYPCKPDIFRETYEYVPEVVHPYNGYRQYTVTEDIWPYYIVKTYIDGKLMETLRLDQIEMEDKLDALEDNCYLRSYTDKQVEIAKRNYQRVAERQVVRM